MEQMFTPNRMGRIGVYPDGSPVVYSPEKAAEKRKEIAERIKAQLEAQGKDASNLRVNFAPELEPENNIDRIPSLERSPETDKFYSAEPAMLAASIKIPPKVQDAAEDVLVDLIKKYGPEALIFLITAGWNKIFGGNKEAANSQKPEKDEQHVLTMDDVTRFQEMHYDKPYFN